MTRCGTMILLAALAALAGCAGGGGRPFVEVGPEPAAVREDGVQTGLASYYGGRYHGRQTASGEIFDQDALTAAHRTLPFGTRVKVTNQRNGRSVTLRINDRGPFVKGRIIDVSRRAARDLDMVVAGVVPVRVQIVD